MMARSKARVGTRRESPDEQRPYTVVGEVEIDIVRVVVVMAEFTPLLRLAREGFVAREFAGG